MGEHQQGRRIGMAAAYRMQKNITWEVSDTNYGHTNPPYLTNPQVAGPLDNVTGGRYLESL